LDVEDEDVLLYYYADALIPSAEDGRLMGRVNKYWPDRGWGFIAATDGNSYFFRHQDISNKKELRFAKEKRSPKPSTNEFMTRLRGKIVSFLQVDDDGKTKAEDIHLEQGINIERYYQLRREPFLKMLEDSGYELVRCPLPKGHTQSKSKSIDCMIYYDALRELQDDQDSFVLVSDDSVFITLLRGLDEDGVKTTVAGFKNSGIVTLAQNAESMLVLDNHLHDLQYDYEEDGDEDARALQSAASHIS
jgi:uncharacterized LabA/DUF88 family protein